MNTGNASTLIQAKFNPLIKPYLVLYVGFILLVTIVLIPMALVWFCGVGQWWARHYFDKLECELGPRALRYRKGILFQVEKTIPLENIQDITFIEGPILKHFQLSILKFETAGQSHGQAHDMQLIGIVDADAFRNLIFQAREQMKAAMSQGNEATSNASSGEEQLLLLKAIQSRLDEIVTLMRDRDRQ